MCLIIHHIQIQRASLFNCPYSGSEDSTWAGR